VNITTPIEHQGSLAGHHQAECSPRVADIKRLKVGVQNQNRIKHHCSLTLRIIARLFTEMNTLWHLLIEFYSNFADLNGFYEGKILYNLNHEQSGG
jgi:hypothetical protein